MPYKIVDLPGLFTASIKGTQCLGEGRGSDLVSSKIANSKVRDIADDCNGYKYPRTVFSMKIRNVYLINGVATSPQYPDSEFGNILIPYSLLTICAPAALQSAALFSHGTLCNLGAQSQEV